MSEYPAELVPIEEACRRLSVGESTLYRALKASQVPGGRRLGGRWIIARAVFERWLVDGIEPGAAEATPLPFVRKLELADSKVS